VGIVPESAVSPSAAVRRTLARALGQWGKSVRPSLVRIGDARAPIVGRISLNECTVDVTDVPSAQLGTEVTVPARLTTLNPNIRRRYHDGS
jgi:hypothetical protein